MKLYVVTISLFCILVAGCNEQATVNTERQVNIGLMSSFSDIAMQNALIAQHTLFPYHFVMDSAELNELGEHDFSVLVKHFTEKPGHLNIRRDNVSTEIYNARVTLIHDRLEEAGIDTGRIRISDGMAGGPGITTERILQILEKSYESTGTTTTTGAPRATFKVGP